MNKEWAVNLLANPEHNANIDIPLKTFYCLGCCASRDTFNSKMNPDYKQFFRVKGTGSQLSLISLMAEKQFDYTDEEITARKLTRFQNRVVEKELKKTCLQELIDLDYDYLIIDNYFDMKFGICRVQDKIFTNNTWTITDTPFYKNLKNKEIITIQDTPDEFYKLWCESCDLFFEFAKKYLPDIKIILNPVRNSTSVIELDGSVVHEKDDTYDWLISENKYISILDEYILNNFDVDVLIFEDAHKADRNHPWTFRYVHYEPSYYLEFNERLKRIIERDTIMDYNSPLAQSIRKNNRLLCLDRIKELNELDNQEIENNKIELANMDKQLKNKELEFKNKYDELQDNLNALKSYYQVRVGKLSDKEYCINCYKEEIQNNKIEIEYIKKSDKLTKKILSPLAYGYILFKSKPNEIGTNIKLYKSIKNSKYFDIGYYLNKYPDVAKGNWCKYFSPELHYVCKGFDENRQFNKNYYKTMNKKELIEKINNDDLF